MRSRRLAPTDADSREKISPNRTHKACREAHGEHSGRVQASAHWSSRVQHTHAPMQAPGPAALTMNAAGLRGARPAAPCPGGLRRAAPGTSGGGSAAARRAGAGAADRSVARRCRAADSIARSVSARQAWLAGGGAGRAPGSLRPPPGARPTPGGSLGGTASAASPAQQQRWEMHAPQSKRRDTQLAAKLCSVALFK